jgi:hypothetical protein
LLHDSVRAWSLPPSEAMEKRVDAEQEPAFVIGVLGEARCFDDERQIAGVELRQGGRRSGTATPTELGSADLSHRVADHEDTY